MLASIVVADSGAQAAVYVLVGAGLVALIAAVVLFRAMWKVPEPNQALLVSGRRHKQAAGDAEPLQLSTVVAYRDALESVRREIEV